MQSDRVRRPQTFTPTERARLLRQCRTLEAMATDDTHPLYRGNVLAILTEIGAIVKADAVATSRRTRIRHHLAHF